MNQRIDHVVTCNSKDAIQINVEVDFLCMPVSSDSVLRTRDHMPHKLLLTLRLYLCG